MIDPLTHEDCWREELAGAHRDLRAEAQLQLGVHYAAQGQTEQAGRAFAAVDPDDNRVAAARAGLRLHRLLIGAGETERAWDALARAAELSDPARSPDVELELAAGAAALGRRDEAERRYLAVMSVLSVRERLGALAAYRLAELCSEQGAADRALTLWRLALQGSDEDLRPHVLLRLADALRVRRQDREAEGLYRQAIATDHPDLAPRAALALANVLERRGALATAVELYALAGASGHRDVAETADLRSRVLQHGRTRAAVDRMRRSDNPDGDDDGDDGGYRAGVRWHPWRRVKLDRLLPRRRAAGERTPSGHEDAHARLHALLQTVDALAAVRGAAPRAFDYVICELHPPGAPDEQQPVRSVPVAWQSCQCGDDLGAPGRWEPSFEHQAIAMHPFAFSGEAPVPPGRPGRPGAALHLLLASHAQTMAAIVHPGASGESVVHLVSGAHAYGLLARDAIDGRDRDPAPRPPHWFGGSCRCDDRGPNRPA